MSSGSVLATKLAGAKKVGISEARVRDALPMFGEYASYWRAYPDKFLDLVTPPGSKFSLYFYQRIFLRVAMRYKYVYATFTRAFSKSFLSVITLYLKCIFYPGSKIFVCSGGKEQAANIAKEKVQEIWEIWPALENEVVKKKCQFGKDYIRVVFKNGSVLDVVGVQNSTRGGRRHSGLIEESILIDGTKLNEIIIPLMNVSRRSKNGLVDPNEPHKAQIFVTTAGYKDTFAYDKMIQFLIWQGIKPGSAFVFGGDYRIPVMHRLLDRGFIEELKQDGTFNEMSFAREYESKWSGSVENAFYSSELFDKLRSLKNSEEEYNVATGDRSYYVMGVDVGRFGDLTAIAVIKVFPQVGAVSNKHIVYLDTNQAEHFEDQAKEIKRLYYEFKPKMVVVDANGLGAGLVDYLVKRTADESIGTVYPPFGVTNDDRYDKFKTEDTVDVLYNIKADTRINSEMHVNLLSQMSSRKMKFLCPEKLEKARMDNTKKWKAATMSDRAKHLKPYTMTSILKEEMLNLRRKHSSGSNQHVVLERVNSRIPKDKFSALEYGLYYVKLIDDLQRKKKKRILGESLAFHTRGSGNRRRKRFRK